MTEKFAFTIVLVFGFLLDFFINFLLIYTFDIDAWISITLSFIGVSVINYYANFYLVFSEMRRSSFLEMRRSSLVELPRYILLMCLVLLARISVYSTVANNLSFSGSIYLALLLAFGFSFCLNYFVCKFIVFKLK